MHKLQDIQRAAERKNMEITVTTADTPAELAVMRKGFEDGLKNATEQGANTLTVTPAALANDNGPEQQVQLANMLSQRNTTLSVLRPEEQTSFMGAYQRAQQEAGAPQQRP